METKLLRTAAIASLFATAFCPARAEATQPAGVELTVVVAMVTPAGIPRDTVAPASRIVEDVYRRFGVIVQWRDPTNAADTANPKAWRRIVIKPSATKEFPAAFGRGRVMGISPRNGDAPGWSAYVFYDAILATARRHDLPVDLLLGYAMAHELGHLLLPADGHGASGVMLANWEEAGLKQMRSRTLAMGPREATLIRQYLDSIRESR